MSEHSGDYQYHIKPDDIVIAVMGVTGVGKSTFISHLTEEDVGIGHGLEGYTSIVQLYKCHLDLKEFYMIDTPGFNDTYKSDTDILREVANWLGNAYQHRVKLAGIIYLHRILDNKVGGRALKNLRMFKTLCGDERLSNVVLATTMWSEKDMSTQLNREMQLSTQPEYWGIMVGKGSRVFRQDQGTESAAKIVRYIIEKNSTMVLRIQRQLIDEGLKLEETTVGQLIQVETRQERLAFEKELQDIKTGLEEAMAQKDQEAEQEWRLYQEEVQGKLALLETDAVKLKADSEALKKQIELELAEDREVIFRERQKNDEELRKQEKILALAEQQSRHDLELEERQFEINRLNAEKAALARRARPWYERLFD